MASRGERPESGALWARALAGDVQAFWELVSPHVEELLRAARREIRYHRALGNLEPDDLAPEELVGMALARAWRGRHRRPEGLDLRAWLLTALLRSLEQTVRQERRLRRLWAVSLEEPAEEGPPIYDDGEEFWEWYQPDDLTRWEDVLPAEGGIPEYAPHEVDELEPRARQTLVLAREHGLTVAEVASATGQTPEEVGRKIQEAHAQLQEIRKRKEVER